MINRNNYEEYFLLLADKELSPVEEAAVMQFAAKHPDLQEELDILLSCRLEAEPMPAFPKEKLLRPTLWNAEKPEAVQTQMLLLLDGELPAIEQQQLETKIAASVALQAEWNSLQQTKLLAEAIVHPNKESLRRNDRKVRPLLWMRWAAAAAVVTGLGWLLWVQQAQVGTPSGNTLAVAPLLKAPPQQAAIQSGSNSQPVVANSSTQPEPIEAVETIVTKEVAATTTQPIKKQAQKTETSTPAEAVTNTNTPTYATLNTIETDPVLATINSADIQLTTTETSNSTTQIAQLTDRPIAAPMLAVGQKQDVFTGSKEVLADAEPEYVSVGGARISKQKVRGLFRNVTRSVARSFSKSKMEPDAYTTR